MMIRHLDDIQYYRDELDMEIPEWIFNAIKLNPDYCAWGSFEDYMIARGQWNSPVVADNIIGGLWGLDNLNEVVNFYFVAQTNEHIYGDDEIHMGLQLWVIHPRKGASRGVFIKDIADEDELKLAIEYLKGARQRNYDRFAGLDDY